MIIWRVIYPVVAIDSIRYRLLYGRVPLCRLHHQCIRGIATRNFSGSALGTPSGHHHLRRRTRHPPLPSLPSTPMASPTPVAPAVASSKTPTGTKISGGTGSEISSGLTCHMLLASAASTLHQHHQPTVEHEHEHASTRSTALLSTATYSYKSASIRAAIDMYNQQYRSLSLRKVSTWECEHVSTCASKQLLEPVIYYMLGDYLQPSVQITKKV